MSTSTPIQLLVLFLTTLPLPPIPSVARGHLSPSALGFPIALTLIPRTAFSTQTPRSWEVARCVQYLCWAWLGIWVWGGLSRTLVRLKKGTLRLDTEPSATATVSAKAGSVGKDGSETNTTSTESSTSTSTEQSSTKTNTRTTATTYTPNPLLTAIILHLISWRLSTTLMLDLPGGMSFPFDTTTLLGLGVGLVCSWAEVGRLLRIAGLKGGE